MGSERDSGVEEEPRLIRVDPEGPWEYVIPEGTTRIGRSRGSDICLRDTTVSRFHCYLLREGAMVRVFDGESRNPARVNDEVVSGQRLRSGHTLRVGKTSFVYEGPLPAAGRPPPGERRLAAPPPRRRARKRAAEPAAVLAVATILLAPAVVWLIVSGLPAMLGKGGRSETVPPGRDSDTSGEIEARIAALLRTAEEERMLQSAESEKKLKDLAAEHLELQAELERFWARAGRPSPPPAPDPAAGTSPAAIPDSSKKLFGSFSIPEDEATGGRTVAVVTRPGPEKRTSKEIRDMAERVRLRLEDYATHAIVPGTIEPDLAKLSRTVGKEAAAALIELEKGARELLRETDASIELNRRRKEDLLRRARQAPPAVASPPAAKEGKGYGEKPVGAGTELDQRQLELFHKAMEIHARHRQFLEPLRIAVLGAISRIVDPEGLDHLRARLLQDPDEDLAIAIVQGFESADYRKGFPALCRRFSSAPSPRLRDAIRKTLTALAGEDLGEAPGPWEEWWEQHKP